MNIVKLITPEAPSSQAANQNLLRALVDQIGVLDRSIEEIQTNPCLSDFDRATETTRLGKQRLSLLKQVTTIENRINREAERTATQARRAAEQAEQAQAKAAARAAIRAEREAERNRLENEKANRKAKAAEEKLAAEEALWKALDEECGAAIIERDLVYVLEIGRYLQRNGTEITYLTPPHLKEIFPQWRDSDWKAAFDDRMNRERRVFTKITSSFRPQPPTTYNLLAGAREAWLQPAEGEVAEIFDLLLDSISGGKAENRAFIERAVRWKWLHPEDFMLPALVLFGEGGTGKNLFTSGLLATIFGTEQVAALKSQSVTGAFNDSVVGKTVVLVDESVADKADMEKLKGTVGNKVIDVNKKMVTSFRTENTAWYILSGNGLKSPIRLDQSDADRRWSLCCSMISLVKLVIERRGMTQREAEVWVDREGDTLRDPVEVSKWLGAIMEKHADQRNRPQALHGEDYRAVAHIQQATWMDLVEAIFHNPDFTHVRRSHVLQMYLHYHQKGRSGWSPLGKKLFFAELRNWLHKHAPWVEERECNAGLGEKRTRTTYFVHADRVAGTEVTENIGSYQNSRGEWLYPEE